MTARELFRFLRPTLIVLAIYAIAWVVGRSLGHWEATSDAPNWANVTAVLQQLEEPRPELQPQDVVRIQLQGLAHPDQAQGVLQCMHFASPDNLTITGPIERFGKIVRSAPYRVLAGPDQVLVGQPVLLQDKARVLVTALHQGQLSSFLWVLSRQSAGKHAQCWLTEGVIPVTVPSQRP